MRRKIVAIVFLLLSGSRLSFAQDYRYSEVYDAFGHVKEIKTDSKNPFVKGKVKIDRNGQSDMPVMMYSDSGYPVGFELNALGVNSFQKFFWNAENRLDSVSVQFPVFGKPTLLTGKNIWIGNTLESQMLKIVKGHEIIEFTRSFSEYIHDENGSWISRSVNQEMTDRSGNKSRDSFWETRKIKFYEPEKKNR